MKIKNPLLPPTILLSLCGVLSPLYSLEPLRPDNDDFNIAEPAEDEAGDYIWSDGAYYMAVYQMEKLLDLGWLLQKFRILPKQEAENIDSLDKVPDSTWFTNRHGRKRMNPAELAHGPLKQAPAPGKWTILKGKGIGINPGFLAKDHAGRLLFVKFDPAKYPGLGLNGDLIASKILHAAGYNVPEYYKFWIDPADLVLSPNATIKGKYKVKRPMTQKDLKGIIAKAPKDERGRLLANVSIGLPGKPKGPFNYLGLRKDDPNDTVRHENRRELRGLRVLMSWLNNTDSRRGNSLDMYVESADRSFLRHYLMDFSASFGSGNIHPKEVEEGHEYFFDPGTVSRSLSSAGLWVKPWERPPPVRYPEVGRYEAESFDPKRWRGAYANPAFEKMTRRDAFWGTRIVTAFTDEDIRTIVATGHFSTPGAEDYLARTLIERRDIIGKHWFALKQINPLDEFRVDGTGAQIQLRFRDLAVARSYAENATTRYQYRIGSGKNIVVSTPQIPLHGTLPGDRIRIRTSRDSGGSWGRPISLDLSADGEVKRVIRH
ncbi:MAG: hypothetical protein CO113_15405 [Elusimicrobia bacterium CG_4_9_14_3_um_filter_62_55]|nr:MAG: hypothetical protein COR54_08645 [Elusimicrobia bacterium CG22_combo_CG10-13_8_21_14_all_63_91]PJA11455.1 MAG: hypothetical protein COX66_19845 [Elusimicrobia bacterium CG_4_10_14_0_2_um_filter_63_34]PJB24158.1 MAG: hypothetical protein CO113_15405 [Elusimicrobia bacterium CG_4_9_14_3_um_filter_62_55]